MMHLAAIPFVLISNRRSILQLIKYIPGIEIVDNEIRRDTSRLLLLVGFKQGGTNDFQTFCAQRGVTVHAPDFPVCAHWK
jgi:hypothetical protein